jgi:hypothetical protein
VIDCDALEFLSQTRNNAIRAVALLMLESGSIKVPHVVWRDFCDIYEDEGSELAPHIAEKIKSKPSHRAAAGAIASRANSGFRLDPYTSSDWMACAVAEKEMYTLVTTPKKFAFYAGILNSPVISITDLV